MHSRTQTAHDGRNRDARSTVMRVMTQPDEPAAESTALTLEILAGRQLRLLRQGRGWSQAEVAERMKAYGYSWNQSTVTRIESASRPTRLNELADLAALYEVPFIRLLRPDPAPDEGESLEAIEREIRSLLRARVNAIHAADAARRWLAAAQEQSYVATDGVQRIDSRLQTLKLWASEIRRDRTGNARGHCGGECDRRRAKTRHRLWALKMTPLSALLLEQARESARRGVFLGRTARFSMVIKWRTSDPYLHGP